MLRIPLASVAVFLAMLVVAASASAADGTGTVTVAPTYVINSSTGNFLTFTYTATGAGMNNGALTFTVPAGWSAPDLGGFNTGATNAACGDFSPVLTGRTVQFNAITLTAGQTCDIHFGISGFGTVVAPAATGVNTFTIQQKSTAGGTLTNIVARSTPVRVRRHEAADVERVSIFRSGRSLVRS